MKTVLYTILLLTISNLTLAQNTSRTFQKFNRKEQVYEITVNDGIYRIQFYTPSIVETSFIPEGETYSEQSHAVVLHPTPVKAKISQTDTSLHIETNVITVSIQKNPFQISYLNDNRPIISEKRGYISDSLEKIQLNLTEQEALYGGGARALNMKRRGHRLKLYNRAHYGYEERSELLNYTMPVVVSSKRYLVHFDNPATGFLDLDSKGNNTLTYETLSGRKTYQVVVGDSWKELIDH